MTNLKKHLTQEHKISPVSTYLREIVYGGIDGIVTTFAVVAGFNGAATSSALTANLPVIMVLLFGMANLFADGVSMALGNFLSVRSNQDVYRGEKEKEREEIRMHPDAERAETMEILQNKGFNKNDAQVLTNIYAKNEKYWLDFMMNTELEMPNPESEKPLLTGLSTFFSFILFGSIPLVPYFIPMNQDDTFIVSIFFTITALILLGLLRFKVTKEKIIRSIGEVVFLGSISALVAYFVGTFFKI